MGECRRRGHSMDESLRAVMLSQLDATQATEAEWAVLALAAVEGWGELAPPLDGGAARCDTERSSVRSTKACYRRAWAGTARTAPSGAGVGREVNMADLG